MMVAGALKLKSGSNINDENSTPVFKIITSKEQPPGIL
jgi:hypothetical protein